ncbi:hypothetical protein MAHJHV29_48420 [Mycobacterium avium subsp. hominissuis]
MHPGGPSPEGRVDVRLVTSALTCWAVTAGDREQPDAAPGELPADRPPDSAGGPSPEGRVDVRLVPSALTCWAVTARRDAQRSDTDQSARLEKLRALVRV